MNILVKFKFTIKTKQTTLRLKNVEMLNWATVVVWGSPPYAKQGPCPIPDAQIWPRLNSNVSPNLRLNSNVNFCKRGEGGCGGEGSCHQTSVRHKFESATCIMFEIQTLNVHLQLMFGELCNNWKMMDDFVLTFVDTCFVWTKNQSANITMQFIICVKCISTI